MISSLLLTVRLLLGQISPEIISQVLCYTFYPYINSSSLNQPLERELWAPSPADFHRMLHISNTKYLPTCIHVMVFYTHQYNIHLDACLGLASSLRVEGFHE